MELMEDRLIADGVKVDRSILRRSRLRGLYVGGSATRPPFVLVNDRLSYREQRCVLAEEAGHHYRSIGLALDRKDSTQWKNELAGRRWAYEELIPLSSLIESWKRGNTTIYDIADDLNVTEDFLRDGIEYLHARYGVSASCAGWTVQFDPYLDVYRDNDCDCLEAHA